MAKFTIIFCVLLFAFGAQAGLISMGMSIAKSNIEATINKMSEMKQAFESDIGFSLEEFIQKLVQTFAEWEGKMIETMEENSGSSTCSQYLTQLIEARNKTIDDMIAKSESMMDTMTSDALLGSNMGDIMLVAAESAEAKITECFSNVFTIALCFQDVKTTFAESVASDMPTLISILLKLTTNKATMLADLATFQLNSITNFNAMATDFYKVLQECTLADGATTA